MKTKFFTLSLTILIIIAFSTNFSKASDKKAYVATENEELYGTWVNEDYNSSPRSAIHEYKANGTWVVYRKTTDEISYKDGTYTITDKWTESNGDVCYNLLSAHKECHFFRVYFDYEANFQNSSSPIFSKLNISF